MLIRTWTIAPASGAPEFVTVIGAVTFHAVELLRVATAPEPHAAVEGGGGGAVVVGMPAVVVVTDGGVTDVLVVTAGIRQEGGGGRFETQLASLRTVSVDSAVR